MRSRDIESAYLVEAARRGGAPEGWMRTVRERLALGEGEYGDRSYGLHPSLILRELAEEIIDVPSWGSILAHSQTSLTSKHWRTVAEARELTLDIAAASCALYRQVDRLSDLLILP